MTEPVDRTIIRLPGSDNLVLVYNKYQEEERLVDKERALREDNYILKPVASIPEANLDIYSRCIVCRMNADGVFESLGEGDYEIWGRYLAFYVILILCLYCLLCCCVVRPGSRVRVLLHY